MTARRSVLLAATLAFAIGCSSDNSGPSGQNGAMTAKIDGTSWSSTSAAVTQNASGGAGTIIAVSGANTAGESIAFAFVTTGPGTYPIDNASPTNAVLIEHGNSWSASVIGGTGTITVTTLTATRIAGTFSFTGVAIGNASPAQRSVTNGVFDVTY